MWMWQKIASFYINYGRFMWYFVWILGLFFAVSFSVMIAIWHEGRL